VRRFFAVHFSGFAWQRFLCRAGAHGKESQHGNVLFSRSVMHFKSSLENYYFYAYRILIWD
jgi:hypothetical protein